MPAGGTDVHAIVNVTCSDAGQAGSGGGRAGEIVVVDTSGSMGIQNMELAKQAAVAAVEQIIDGTWFAVVAGNHRAYLAYPRNPGPVGMVQMNPQTRFEAVNSIRTFRAEGGTAIGSWLNLTRALFESVPDLSQRHALLLTDGENHNETPVQLDAAIRASIGAFQADCRGVGTDWVVAEIRRISQALLGTVDIIPEPSMMPRVFAELIQQSMGRGVAEATLRVWAPQGAQVLFCRQVLPQVEDLTHRGTPVNPLTVDFPTGAWGDESRDYHVAVRLAAREIGQEQLAARVQLVVGQQPVTQGLVKARWSDDDALTTRIDPAVAHYTGQTELAEAIQAGLAAKAAGRTDEATTRLGRAVQLAAETGNEEATSRLRKVVDVDDAETGTVRLKKSVDKADEMALDTASTKTTRTRG
nr:VWA domain-containing protein [Naumannella cuiyingiana]